MPRENQISLCGLGCFIKIAAPGRPEVGGGLNNFERKKKKQLFQNKYTRSLAQLCGLGLLHICTSHNSTLKIQVTLDIVSCRLVNRYRRFEGTDYFTFRFKQCMKSRLLDRKGEGVTFLRNVGICLLVDVRQHP